MVGETMYRFRLDNDQRVLHVHVSGRWNSDEIKRFIRDLFKHAEIARQRFRRLLLLIDARDIAAPDEDDMTHFRGVAPNLLNGPDDKSATLVPNYIAKAHARWTEAGTRQSVFLSESSALTWLMGYVPGETADRMERLAG
jgi:hypothetical protein